VYAVDPGLAFAVAHAGASNLGARLENAVYLELRRGLHGTRGGLIAGLLFILPGFLSILALSILYATFGHLGLVAAIFLGLKPAVLAIVLEALARLRSRALPTPASMVIAAAAFLMGLGFLNMVIAVRGETMLVPVTELFYQTPYFWMIVLLTSPIITMRLFALEKYAGTFETLMTTPVRDTAVVLAKFSAALVFFLVLWLPLAGCFFILRQMTGQGLPMDWGAVGATGLGILLLGCLFCSIGCFASSLTRTQTVAAMLGLALGVGLFLVGMLAGRPPAGLAAWQAASISSWVASRRA